MRNNYKRVFRKDSHGAVSVGAISLNTSMTSVDSDLIAQSYERGSDEYSLFAYTAVILHSHVRSWSKYFVLQYALPRIQKLFRYIGNRTVHF
jgi:hypothetical protein